MSNNDIGRRIRYLRDVHELTLEQVGDVVGVGKSTVRKWETGEIANMRRDKIAKLAEALHTTPAYLMGWTDDPSPDAMIFSECTSAEKVSVDDLILQASAPRDPLQDRDVLFALFGGADDITPEMMEDVRRFAHFVREQKAKSQDKGKDGPTR